MSENDAKTFPVVPVKRWWTLRELFKRTIPGTVTPNYLSTVLKMKPTSARANIMPSLKRMGIIDDDGKPTERATKWRDDAQYAAVCEAIKAEVYPQELLDAVPNPVADRAAAESWFGNRTHAGKAAVQKMAACYALLLEADPSKRTQKTEPKPLENKARRDRPKEKKEDRTPKAKADPSGETAERNAPGLCVNLQVHISSDASPDQIDQIFKSMAKHIYREKNVNE